MKIDTFISDHVTFRKESLLKSDYEKLQTTLSTRLNDKSVLVIGGAVYYRVSLKGSTRNSI